MTAKKIAFYNNKGGMLKTTSTSEIAGILATQGKKILLIDGDPQGNLSYVFGHDSDVDEITLFDVLMKNMTKEEVNKIILPVHENIDLIPTNNSLSNLTVNVSGKPDATKRLGKLLNKYIDDYDYILIDTAPGEDLMLANVFAVVDDLILLTRLEPLAVKKLKYTLDVTESFQVPVRRIVPTATQLNTATHKAFLEDVRELAEAHNTQLTNHTIPQTIKFAEAQGWYGMPLSLVDQAEYSKQKKYYEDIVKELGY